MILRQEHPKPQFEREDWENLNGEWQFEIDRAQSGQERGLYKKDCVLKDKIIVPFCPESKLSGIGDTDFMQGVCYKRKVCISKEHAENVVKLHFGAVDYECTLFVNEQCAGTHRGGYSSFSYDITALVHEGENDITVFVKDDTRSLMEPSGKQSGRHDSFSCFYTRTTGIWQTVWLEFFPDTHVENVKYYPNIQDGTITVNAILNGVETLKTDVYYEGRSVGTHTIQNASGNITFTVPLSEKHLWEIGNGRLYDIVFTFGKDKVKSYFGLRSVRLAGKKFLLNEKPVFLRMILDQGFYPDGIYTAPSDDELKNDILRSMAFGFTGARLHEKVFEERFLYHCDKLGYIVWGEYPDWGIDFSNPETLYPVMREWMEVMNRDFNHPSIIGWCPHNETWDYYNRRQHDEALAEIYRMTKAIDPTRPCIDTSGNYHVETDIFDVHDYCQSPAEFKEYYDKLNTGNYVDRLEIRQHYDGYKPFFVSEYGGIAWAEDDGWGYGNAPKTKEELIERFCGLADAIMDNPSIMGLCYTQLTDVEQEQNGLYYYNRTPKFDPEPFKKALGRKAAIEE